MDWKDVIRKSAPSIGGLLTTFGGPVGIVATAGLTALANVIGVPTTGDAEVDGPAVASAMQAGLSPEQTVAVVAADAEVRKAMIAAGVREKELAVEETKSYLTDAADARAHNAQNIWVIKLGFMIILGSFVSVFSVLVASFCMMVFGGEAMSRLDPGMAAMLGGLVGTALGWVLASGNQAISFFFGTTPSARTNATKLSEAASAVMKKSS